MNKTAFLTCILLGEARQNKFVLKSLFFSILFVLFAVTITNLQNFSSILKADYEIIPKVAILFTFFLGSFYTISPLDLTLLILSSVFFGINIQLVLRKFKYLAKKGGLRLTFGAGIVSIVATGCASCGLSFVSLIGLGSVISLLPFGGIELYMLSLFSLIFLLYFNVNSYTKACEINQASR